MYVRYVFRFHYVSSTINSNFNYDYFQKEEHTYLFFIDPDILKQRTQIDRKEHFR